MKQPDPNLFPDWDEYNVLHIARHNISPEQVEELYYSEGVFPTIVGRNKCPRGKEIRYRLWGTDAAGNYIEAIIAIFPRYGVWRCITACRMTQGSMKAYLKKVRR